MDKISAISAAYGMQRDEVIKHEKKMKKLSNLAYKFVNDFRGELYKLPDKERTEQIICFLSNFFSGMITPNGVKVMLNEFIKNYDNIIDDFGKVEKMMEDDKDGRSS